MDAVEAKGKRATGCSLSKARWYSKFERVGWSDRKPTWHVGARHPAFCIQPTTAQGGKGPEPHTRPSTSGQSIGVGYVHRMKRHCGANPHVGEFAACVCVMFACIARVMAVRWKMRCRREHGRLASETATALLQSQPCEQIDTSGPDGGVRCKTSHQRRKHAMHPILLLGGDTTKLPMFANRLRNAHAPGFRDTRMP